MKKNVVKGSYKGLNFRDLEVIMTSLYASATGNQTPEVPTEYDIKIEITQRETKSASK